MFTRRIAAIKTTAGEPKDQAHNCTSQAIIGPLGDL
jgi:hypothetical protein